MVKYVFKDSGRKNHIYPIQASKKDIGQRYYCPDTGCDAHMYVCGLNGLSSAYFRATHNGFAHIDGCGTKRRNSFDAAKVDEKNFNFSEAINSMFTPSNRTNSKKVTNPHRAGKSKLKPLRTIRQIYDMCRAHVCTDNYNGIPIWEMLFDDRSEYKYPKEVLGAKIIEAHVAKSGYFYDPDKMEIIVLSPNSEKHEFILKFNNNRLYRDMRDRIYPNIAYKVLVEGDWSHSGKDNIFATNITSSKQIAILK